MKRRTGRVTWGVFLSAALLLLGASAVWACTAQPRIFSLGPQVGPVGLEIILEGQIATATQVEVRWNSLDGAKIGEGMANFNGSFAVATRIPEAKPGVYFLVVRAGDAGVFRSPFEVTGEQAVGPTGPSPAAPAAASTDLWEGFSAGQSDLAQRALATQRASGSGMQAAIGGAFLAVGVSALALGVVSAKRRGRLLTRPGRSRQS